MSDLIRSICKNLVKNELTPLSQKNEEHLTSGEKIYLKHNISGVRGEAENGFPRVTDYGLPALKEGLNSGLSLNDSSLHALCNIMSHLDDTALLNRHNINILERSSEEMKKFCKEGGLISKKSKKILNEFNIKYNHNNINPGGSADLLAVTLMYYFLEKSNERDI